jgi:Protein of unknown function (DUF1761)
MPGVNLLAVVVATIAAFVLSSIWYIIFGKAWTEHLGKVPGATADIRKTPAWKRLAELVRSFVFSYVLACVIALAGIRGWTAALQFGFLVWLGFPFMILSGSVLWDRVPWKLAAIHVGDWFMKVLALTVILAVWR